MTTAPGVVSLKLLEERLALARAFDGMVKANPRIAYKPHDDGQRQFHEALHRVRALLTGNGFGKTWALAAEFDAWCTHANRWQVTPAWAVRCLWFTKISNQWELIRQDIQDRIVGPKARYTSDDRFTYPDGSFCQFAFVNDQHGWTKWQGPNPDLILFDELPPKNLWNEMGMRARGMRDTKFVFGCTATTGMNWMWDVIYKPWIDYHAKLGMDKPAARLAQKHPDLWVWDRGGIFNNPGASQSQRDWFLTHTAHLAPKERQVRLHGGMEDWVGDGLFDDEALDWMVKTSEEMALDRQVGFMALS